MAPPGRRRHHLSPAAILLGLTFFCAHTASAASAVLGIDIGTEYIKAALVKPGIPLEIVLTKDSKRKDLSAVAFKPSKSGAYPAGEFPERYYGSDAVALAARFPADVYPNIKQLLGVGEKDAVVDVFTGRYPALKTEGLEGRKTVALKSDVFAEGEKPWSVEELLAMELKNVKDNAKALAGKGVDITDVVITVPPFYTVEERRALEVSAKLAGFKVLNLVTDGLAVGLNYGMSRTFPNINDGGKAEINLVFDMGAGSASATVLKFQGRSVKDVGKRNKTVQEVQVLGTGWDKTLGGDALNQLIVDHMVAEFTEDAIITSLGITAEKIKTHGRTAAKLWKDAEKIRQILSANTATGTYFESFWDDKDFKYKITRTEFETLAANHAARVEGPINRALEAAGLTLADIDSLIIHGGASRTPFVQQRLEALVGRPRIKSNVNSDEAAVFGAAFKAADLSPSFRVKEIRDTDLQGYNQGIQYMFNMKDRDQKIFTPGTKIGATKDLPFQMMGEFEFAIYQSVPNAKGEIVKDPVLHFISGNLTRAVTKMIDTDGCDRESFNNYVQVRLSPVTGTPEVVSAWVTCETEEAKPGLVDGVKNFFGMGDKKDQEPLKEGESASESASSASSKSSKASKSASSSSAAAAAEASEDAKVPKKKTIKSDITFTVAQKGYEKHPRKEFKRMEDRLAAFDASDKARQTREEVLNSLEAFTYKARDYLEDESFLTASTAAIRATLEDKFGATSDWIYSDGPSATLEALKAKLKELEDIVKPVLTRKQESVDRPDAIKAFEANLADVKTAIGMIKTQIEEQKVQLSKSAESASKLSASSTETPSPSASADPLDDLEEDSMLTASSSKSAASNEPTEVPIIYTEEDLKTTEDLHKDASKWLEEKQAAQKNLKEHEDPALTTQDLKAETEKLNTVIMRMMMKKAAHYNAPKSQKPKAKTTKSKKASATKKADKEAKKSDSAKPKEDEKPKEPTQAELDEALEKAGLKADGIKLEKVGEDGKEVRDKDGNLLSQLKLEEGATEEDIRAAIDRATREGRERVERERVEKEKEKDEL
ncbi:heat shock protein 70-like protein-like protein [Massarina eburnea CBS 473.64]|uniref:Heat shock protein 70-like protein-like protein n=1 Tax=Massarina eburnea CBS 473.64 TaxID=1395130 RepID=A0A6A6S2P9_9PLEO|nr:heat shock protein 70-like protein-like protein [Massarina eburnea CBS 473.64]